MNPAGELWMGNFEPLTLAADFFQNHFTGKCSNLFIAGAGSAAGIALFHLDDDMRGLADQRAEDPSLIIFKITDL